MSGRWPAPSRILLPCGLVGLALLTAACEKPMPRSFAVFMDDRIAMEGTLAFCNENREATLNDIECANARRASITIALREERDRRQAYQIESERKLNELRTRLAHRERIAREAAMAALAAEEEAYENLWRQPANVPGVDASLPPREAAPTDRLGFIGPLSFDGYAD